MSVGPRPCIRGPQYLYLWAKYLCMYLWSLVPVSWAYYLYMYLWALVRVSGGSGTCICGPWYLYMYLWALVPVSVEPGDWIKLPLELTDWTAGATLLSKIFRRHFANFSDLFTHKSRSYLAQQWPNIGQFIAA